MFKISLFVFFVTCMAATAKAEVVPQINYTYYPVTPVPGQSLYEQIFHDTPLGSEDNAKIIGNINWPIGYRWKSKPESMDTCSIDKLEVSCECRIRLPELKSSDFKLISQFNAFQETVRVHELTHCRIATDYANLFENRVKTLGTMNCDQMEAIIKEIFIEVMEMAHKDQIKFDEQELINHKYYDPAKELLGKSYPSDPKDAPKPQPTLSLPKSAPDLGGIYKDKNGVWRNH